MGTMLFQLPVLPLMLIGWLNFLVPAVLCLAAFLNWRLSRHWSLLLLAIAALCFLLGYVSSRIGEMPLRGATFDQIASGSGQPIQPLITLRGWLVAASFACAGIGAVGSIRHQLGTRRHWLLLTLTIVPLGLAIWSVSPPDLTEMLTVLPCAFVLAALSLAAFLHWKLARHWSLLVLAIAPLCFVLWYLSFCIGEMGLQGATLEEIASGARHAIQPFITLSGWVALVGFACAGIGAIGSIYRALRLGRQTSNGAQSSVAVPAPPAC